jgi:hypothetical protein
MLRFLLARDQVSQLLDGGIAGLERLHHPAIVENRDAV